VTVKPEGGERGGESLGKYKTSKAISHKQSINVVRSIDDQGGGKGSKEEICNRKGGQ
jgi:hypothetical protein